MTEGYEAMASASFSEAFEIEPGVNVRDYPWYSDGEGKVQIGSSPTGTFRYVQPYLILVDGRRIRCAVTDGPWGVQTFYRRPS